MDTAVAVIEPKQNGVIQWTPDQVETIRATVAKGANDNELKMFLHLSQTYGLDPFAKEIWFIKMRDTPTIITSRDGYMKIANNSPDYEGMESDVVYEGDTYRKTRDGVDHQYAVTKRGRIVGAYALIYRKGIRFPFYFFAPFSDYNKNNDIWRTYPHAMILKVAEAMALKRAFSLSGLVTREELDTEGVDALPLPPRSTMPSEAHQAPKRMENTSEPQKSAPVPSMKGRMKNIWTAYLEVCGGQKDHAQNAILAVTEGRGSQEWTPQDIEFLEGDLLRRQQERNAPATFGESVRDSDPEGIALAESKGIGPDLDEKPVTLEATPPPPKFASEAETLRARLIDTLTAGGWTLEEADTWIQENFRKQLKQLTKDELRAAISKANDELDARDGIKEAI